MPKVKLFRVYGDGYDNDNILQQLSEGWQEVTQEELNFLTSYEASKMFCGTGYYMKVIIFEDITEEIPIIISSIKEYIADYKAKEEKRKLDNLKKKQETKAKKEQKSIEKAKKLLEAKGLL
jgi:S-ribosylhomocysteine lyase LuxS involved in autoinducer biosynthesis